MLRHITLRVTKLKFVYFFSLCDIQALATVIEGKPMDNPGLKQSDFRGIRIVGGGAIQKYNGNNLRKCEATSSVHTIIRTE